MKKTLFLLFNLLSFAALAQDLGPGAPNTGLSRRAISLSPADSDKNVLLDAKTSTRVAYDIARKVAGNPTSIDVVPYTSATVINYVLTPERIKKFGSAYLNDLTFSVKIGGIPVPYPYSEYRDKDKNNSDTLYIELGKNPVNCMLSVYPGVGHAAAEPVDLKAYSTTAIADTRYQFIGDYALNGNVYNKTYIDGKLNEKLNINALPVLGDLARKNNTDVLSNNTTGQSGSIANQANTATIQASVMSAPNTVQLRSATGEGFNSIVHTTVGIEGVVPTTFFGTDEVQDAGNVNHTLRRFNLPTVKFALGIGTIAAKDTGNYFAVRGIVSLNSLRKTGWFYADYTDPNNPVPGTGSFGLGVSGFASFEGPNNGWEFVATDGHNTITGADFDGYYRQLSGGVWSAWVRSIHSGNISQFTYSKTEVDQLIRNFFLAANTWQGVQTFSAGVKFGDGTTQATAAAPQVQADYNVTDPASKAYIKNKPLIPTQAQIGIRFSKQVTLNSSTNTVSIFHNQTGITASSLVFYTVRSDYGKSPTWAEVSETTVTFHYDYTIGSGNTITYNVELVP